jgi:hypothetical protein
MMDLFAKGSRWKHRSQGHLVHILELDGDKFLLAWAELPEDPMARLLLSGSWSAQDLVRDFTPVVDRTSKWDRLLDDESALAEDVR